jgi:hypothetical protein
VNSEPDNHLTRWQLARERALPAALRRIAEIGRLTRVNSRLRADSSELSTPRMNADEGNR